MLQASSSLLCDSVAQESEHLSAIKSRPPQYSAAALWSLERFCLPSIRWPSISKRRIWCTVKVESLLLVEIMWRVLSDLSEFYGTSGCTVCQRVCSTCRMHMSLQWACPASAASAPIWTRPRTSACECARCCRIRTEILAQCIPLLWATPQLRLF